MDEQPRQERRRGSRRSTLYRSVAHSAYYPSRKSKHAATSLRQRAHHDSSTSSSEDSDEAQFQRRKARSMRRARGECLPMNFTREDVSSGPIRDRARIGSSLADVSPMNIDQSITFEDIGGLKQHIRALKEMIMFPLLYPEVFDRFKIIPPRGVLFHGPPGCGKTLVARALANECSKGGKKVAFFMRKGADCLSKWVGESERQLRLLFDQVWVDLYHFYTPSSFPPSLPLPPSYLSSLPPFLPPSILPFLFPTPSLPPSYLSSFPPSLPPSFPISLTPSLPPFLPPLHPP